LRERTLTPRRAAASVFVSQALLFGIRVPEVYRDKRDPESYDVIDDYHPHRRIDNLKYRESNYESPESTPKDARWPTQLLIAVRKPVSISHF
jgi:hypothetical protein